MKRFIAPLVGVAATAVFALGGSTAGAASPSQAECEAAGGQFQRVNGQVECVIVEEGKNPKFTDTQTTTGQGNISNKQQQTDECDGTGSNKCPPGQF